MIKFSIIVPIYNVEKYLESCITSLIEQTYQDFEIILVDDGSKDNCPDICDKFAAQDNRIKVIHKPNGGVTNARKAGANAAKGDYILCVDADDWVETTYLERFSQIIETYIPDIICCEHFVSNGENKEHKKLNYEEGLYRKKDIKLKIYPDLIEGICGSYFPNSVAIKAVRRELFVKYQNTVDDNNHLGEDGAVIKPCIYEADSLYIMKEPLYYYRYNPDSLTKGRKPFNWQEPKLRGQHLEKQIDMGVADFQEQVYRMVVHSLFNVTESQFNRKEPYSVIAKEIRENLKDEYYKNAIKKCKFKGKKGRLALFALKYKVILLIKAYNSIRQF